MLSKAMEQMMTVVRTAISSTRAARSDKAHLTFSLFGLLFERRSPFGSHFSVAASKLDKLMTGEALATGIEVKRF